MQNSVSISTAIQLVRASVLTEKEVKAEGPLDEANALLRGLQFKEGTPAAAIQKLLHLAFEELYDSCHATPVSTEDYLATLEHLQTLVTD